MLCCIITVEILLRSNLVATIKGMNSLYRKSFALVAKKGVSDHWKERVLPQYSLLIFKQSWRLLLNLIAIFSPFIIAVLIARPFGLDLLEFLSSAVGLIAATAIALIYGFARTHYAKK